MIYIAQRTEETPEAPPYLTFHGTGGEEHQFHRFARQLIPTATTVSPRGDVEEGGANRYFRRTSEGVYDQVDLARAVAKMAAFVAEAKAGRASGETIGLIPSLTDHNPLAQSRIPMEVMRDGQAVRRFQALQQ